MACIPTMALAQVDTLPAAPNLVAAAQTNNAQVTIDQQPLTVRQPIPPNIVLMLDDSGSMAADYMPDWDYLKDNDNNDAVIDSANNGVYYNPVTTYDAPPLAEPVSATSTTPVATTYPVETDMANVPQDGFGVRTTEKVNLFTYDGNFECNDSGSCGNGRGGITFNVSIESSTAPQRSYDKDVEQEGDWNNRTYADEVCKDIYQSYSTGGNYSFTGTEKDWDGDNWKKGECKFTYNAYVYFQYSTGDAAGPYTVHYIAPTSQGCASQANCVTDDDISGTAAPSGIPVGQNVANWFAYYHTRILMAKSSVMSAFSTIDQKYRIGFGSIDGSGAAWIKANATTSSPFSTSTKSENYLAEVQPFGSGSVGSQKAKLWDWIGNEVSAGGSTPLRGALQAVGKYYQTAQPWQSANTTTSKTETLACRQAYTVLTTDGFWNGGTPSGINNADGNEGPKITGPNGNTFQYEPRDPFKDDTSNTLADVAMYYWEHDLADGSGSSPNIANEVPTNAQDPAFWQHMVTFTIGMGFPPSDADGNTITSDWVADLLKWSTSQKSSDEPSGWGGWPTPSGSGTLSNISDLVHAGVNGHGGFYSATSPQSFTSGLKNALNRASERNGTGASLAANSTQLKTGTVAYQAVYHTSIWTGQLLAFSVDSTTGKIGTSSLWDASQALPAPADRKIYTYNPTAKTYVAFKNDGTTLPALSTTELDALGSSATDQASMIDYLRGDVSKDVDNGGSYRNRKTPQGVVNVLGDIVDSQPVYVGAVNADEFVGSTFPGSGDFAQFASDQSGRSGRVYVAANDGMVHAFDTENGAETYAFLPGAVITAGNIKQLADVDYGTGSEPHQYFNDGQLTVADAYFKEGTDTAAAWHSILVGTTGKGLAKTIYALDVTNPASIRFLWERSAGDTKPGSDYIGQMTGKPIVAQVAGQGNSTNWVVLMGNGYNSTKGSAALLQFDLATGNLKVYTTDDSVTANGLAAPAVWMDDGTNGVSTTAYAGDLFGNVWQFDLSAASNSSSTGIKQFVAKDGGGKTQPITAGMLIGKNPKTQDLWLFFGTGRYLAAGDLSDTSVQSWYGIIVESATSGLAVTAATKRCSTTSGSTGSGTGTGGGTGTGTGTASESDCLVQRKIIAQLPGTPAVTDSDGNITTPAVLPTRVVSLSHSEDSTTPSITNESGWYIDLETPTMDSDGGVTGYVDEGERMATPNQFQGSLLLGTTRIPKSGDICNPSGTGWIMALDPFTGTNPDPSFFDVNGDGRINTTDKVTIGGKTYPAAGVGFTSLPNNPIFVGGDMLTSFSNGTTSSLMTSGAGNNIQRVSWREMVNQ
ncbi:MAG TPA: PilC/PilY family type IV pilus protein [Rhodanobacteraceae bacterium]